MGRRRAIARAKSNVRLLPSARELFAMLRPRLIASRPVIGHELPRGARDQKSPVMVPIYGKPTFRNVIENGEHV